MSGLDSQTTPALTKEQQLQNIEQIRDLFARAHDYIAQANHPGHLGMKVAEVLNFLSFQYGDFKQRAETLAQQIKSEVDVVAAKAAADAVLAGGETYPRTIDAPMQPVVTPVVTPVVKEPVEPKA